jgi:hypothetical protein
MRGKFEILAEKLKPNRTKLTEIPSKMKEKSQICAQINKIS